MDFTEIIKCDSFAAMLASAAAAAVAVAAVIILSAGVSVVTGAVGRRYVLAVLLQNVTA